MTTVANCIVSALLTAASVAFAGPVSAETLFKIITIKDEIVVGVNAFPDGNERFSLFPDETGSGRARGLTISPDLERDQKRELARWRADRDAKKRGAAMATLEKETVAGHNVMPPLLAAVRAGATLGEVAELWRGLFGEYRPPRTF